MLPKSAGGELCAPPGVGAGASRVLPKDTLTLVTVNCNSWSTGQRTVEWLHDQAEDVDILCLQETRLKEPARLRAAQAWARRRGYNLDGAPAASTGPGALQ